MEGKGKAKDQTNVRTGSWLSKLRLGGSSNIKKGHLGEENQMYYNQELKRWVERGKEDEARAEMAPAAPPIVPVASITPRDGPLSSSMSKTKLARYVPTPGLSNSSSNNALGTTSFVVPPAASGPSGFGTLSAPGSFAAGMPPVTKFFIPGGGEQQSDKPVNMYAQQPKVLPPASEGDSADSASVGSSDEGKEQAGTAALTQAAAAAPPEQTTAVANSYQSNGNGHVARASGGGANGFAHSRDGQPSSAHAWSAAVGTPAAEANGFMENAHEPPAAGNMRAATAYGHAGPANGPAAASTLVHDLGPALHPGVAGKLDGPLPWELPDHLKHSDQFISICANWHINNPGVRYTPDLLLPNPAPAVAPGAPRSAPAALAPIPLEPTSMYGAPHTTATIEHTPAYMPASDPPAMPVAEYAFAQQQASVLEDPEGAQGAEQQGSAVQPMGTLGSVFEPARSQDVYAPGWEVLQPAEGSEQAGAVPEQQSEPTREHTATYDYLRPQHSATHELQPRASANGHVVRDDGASALQTAASVKAADSSEPGPVAGVNEAADDIEGSMPLHPEGSTGVLQPQVLDHSTNAQSTNGQELGGERSEATEVDPSGEGLQPTSADGQYQAPQTQEDLQQAAIAYAQYWAQVSCDQYGQEHWDYYYALCYDQYMQSVQQPSQQQQVTADVGMVIVMGDSGADPEASAEATVAVPEQQPADDVAVYAPDAAADASEFAPLITLGGGIADAPTSYPSSGQTTALAEELVSAALGNAMAELQADTMVDHIVGLAVDQAAAQPDSQLLAAELCQREGSEQQGSAKKQRTEVGQSFFELVIQSSELPAVTQDSQIEHEPQPAPPSPSAHEPQPVMQLLSEQRHEVVVLETLASGDVASPQPQVPTKLADTMAGFSQSAGMLEQLLAAVRQGQQAPQAVLHGPQGLLQLLGNLTAVCRELAGEPAVPEARPPTTQSQGAATEPASSNDESSTVLQSVASAAEPSETGAGDGPAVTSAASVQQPLSHAARAEPEQAVMSVATHEALLSQRMEELRAAHDSQVQELQATFQRAHTESQAAFETRLEEEKDKLTQQYQQRMDQMAAQLAEVQQQYESSQADNDGLFECLGLEEEKVVALSTIMREAGLDPDPTLQALEQQFEDKLAAQEAGDANEV